ncbi:MAG: RNA polymerase sigma factor [Clostridia bacterium]|nr:RNA polymerase sigma factor [Clostridia bacterium]MBQ8369472.1 RNA polymerase sigma factor [Clostridia bacterium]
MLWLQMLSVLSEEDSDFVAQIYEQYADEMYSTALKIMKNDHDAQSAVSDIMYTIILNLDKYQGQDTESIRNQILIYIRCKIRNLTINAYNKRKRIWSHETGMYYYDDNDEEVDLDFADESLGPDDLLIDLENVERIRQLLLRLPEHMQDAVNLVCLCRYNSIEAGRVLNLKPGTVRARVFQARKKLKEMMKEEDMLGDIP